MGKFRNKIQKRKSDKHANQDSNSSNNINRNPNRIHLGIPKNEDLIDVLLSQNELAERLALAHGTLFINEINMDYMKQFNRMELNIMKSEKEEIIYRKCMKEVDRFRRIFEKYYNNLINALKIGMLERYNKIFVFPEISIGEDLTLYERGRPMTLLLKWSHMGLVSSSFDVFDDHVNDINDIFTYFTIKLSTDGALNEKYDVEVIVTENGNTVLNYNFDIRDQLGHRRLFSDFAKYMDKILIDVKSILYFGEGILDDGEKEA